MDDDGTGLEAPGSVERPGPAEGEDLGEAVDPHGRHRDEAADPGPARPAVDLDRLLRPKVAWLVLAGCALFWTAALLGMTRSPSDTAPLVVLGWLYLVFGAVIISTVLAVASVALLVTEARNRRQSRDAQMQE